MDLQLVGTSRHVRNARAVAVAVAAAVYAIGRHFVFHVTTKGRDRTLA